MKKRIVTIILAMTLSLSLLAGCGNKNSEDRSSRRNNANDSYEAGRRLKNDADYDMYDVDYESDSYDETASEVQLNGGAMMDTAKSNGEEVLRDGGDNPVNKKILEDKLVYEANITVETLDFDSTYSKLQEMITSLGGRVDEENYDANAMSYTNGRRQREGYLTTKTDSLVIKIPADKYEEFINSDVELGNVIEKSQSLTNISQEYYSTETKVELLKGELEYYKTQLANVEEKLADCEDYEYVIQQMIDLEDRIVNVQDQINYYSNSVVTMDMQVAYSTIYLTLTEVKEYTDIETVKDEKPDNFSNRFKDNVSGAYKSFCSFLETVLYSLIYMLPYLIITAIIVTIVVVATKKNKKKKMKAIASNANKIADTVNGNADAFAADKETDKTAESVAENADASAGKKASSADEK